MTPANPRSTARRNVSKRRFSNNVPPGLHYLPPLDPKSEEFAALFRSFLWSKDERTNILALSEEDAKLFIEIIDKAFRAARLEPELRAVAFGVLRKLCGRIGYLPESYLLSHKSDLSGSPRASGGFADIRMGVFKGKDVAIKTLRVLELEDKARIRKRFCKEVALWKNLSHPNILNLLGVPDTLEDGRFSMVSEWMANGNIVEYVRDNAGNHLKLLADAIEGLKYLHNANIVHGDLKGANILITNANPVTACLADFGLMTIVYDPSLDMDSSKSEMGGGTTQFMAPELLIPSRFGLDNCAPSKQADIYAIGMVIYQVLTGTPPFAKLSGSEVVVKVLGGGKPSKPADALEFGLSDGVWKLLEDCWKTERTLRPSVKDALGRVKAAASVCGTLPSSRGPQWCEDPKSHLNKFDGLFTIPPFGGEGGVPESYSSSSLTNPPLAVDTLFPRSPTPGTARPQFIRDNSGTCLNGRFAESNGSNRTLLTDVVPQREQPRSDTYASPVVSTVVPNDRDVYAEKPSVGNLLAPSFSAVPDVTVIATAGSRDDPTHQPHRPTSLVQTDGDGIPKPRRTSRFRIRERLGRVFDPILHGMGDFHM